MAHWLRFPTHNRGGCAFPEVVDPLRPAVLMGVYVNPYAPSLGNPGRPYWVFMMAATVCLMR